MCPCILAAPLHSPMSWLNIVIDHLRAGLCCQAGSQHALTPTALLWGSYPHQRGTANNDVLNCPSSTHHSVSTDTLNSDKIGIVNKYHKKIRVRKFLLSFCHSVIKNLGTIRPKWSLRQCSLRARAQPRERELSSFGLSNLTAYMQCCSTPWVIFLFPDA